MRESIVEKQFVEAVRAAGGQALKFTSQTMNGVPDRLVLLLGGKCAFVELKAPGKQMRLLQRKRRQQLEALGFPVFCVDRPEQIQPAINALLRWNPGDPIPQGIGGKRQTYRRGESKNGVESSILRAKLVFTYSTEHSMAAAVVHPVPDSLPVLFAEYGADTYTDPVRFPSRFQSC